MAASNSRMRTIRYQPRYTQMEAFDRLPETIRRALWEGAQEWDTVSILTDWMAQAKRVGPVKAAEAVVLNLWLNHYREIDQGKTWRTRGPFQRWEDVPQSPHNQARATMQLSGWQDVPDRVWAWRTIHQRRLPL